MKLDVLAIGAHPDDVELSCGGTICKLVKQGRRVGLLDLTAGELGTRGTAELRAQEAASASAILGVQVRENLGLPDGNIQLCQENILKVMSIIRKFTPDILLIPHSVDRHPDHEHAHRLSREAWFYSGLEKLPTSLDGMPQQPFRPRAYYHFMQWLEFAPSFIVDITDEFEQRMKAVHAFRSQFYNPTSTERETALSDPEFMKYLHTRYEYYGDKIGKRYGEPFFSPASIGIADLFQLSS